MKTKPTFIMLIILLSSIHAKAQLLKELKKRAEEKGLETKEVSYDSTLNEQNRTYTAGEDVKIKSAEDFFTKDVVMALYDHNGELTQTAFFDKESIAMRTEPVGGSKPIYHDKSGKFYAYNESVGQYESTSILPASTMGFMTAGLTTQLYKLPQEPYFEAFEALSKLDIGLNFLILEMAFIYKPSHFEGDDFYVQSQVGCGSNTCTRFNYNDAEYDGSYIQFDAQGRLRELYIVSSNPKFKENPSGKFVYSYKPVTVKLPDAVEKSAFGPLGEMLQLEKGLEPWKHNKKDKEKKKNDN